MIPSSGNQFFRFYEKVIGYHANFRCTTSVAVSYVREPIVNNLPDYFVQFVSANWLLDQKFLSLRYLKKKFYKSINYCDVYDKII